MPETLLPLDSFRRLLGLHPWHFWQLAGPRAPITAACDDLLYQEAWINADATGRTEIVEAIAVAEAKLIAQLGYAPAPRATSRAVAYRTPLRLEPYVTRLGALADTLIGTAAVTYSDQDGDGLAETATLTLATTITDPARLVVRFRAADDPDQAIIRPLRLVADGAQATITGPAWLFARRVLYGATPPQPLNADDPAMFVAAVEVVDRTLSSAPVYQLAFDPTSCCGATPTDPGLTLGLLNGAIGLIAARRSCDAVWCDPFPGCCVPTTITVSYEAGLPLVNGQMAIVWQRTIAALAAAELARPICACDGANRALYHWQFDLARTGGANDESYGAISASDLDNPLGTRRGHVHAWRMIKQFRHLGGVAA